MRTIKQFNTNTIISLNQQQFTCLIKNCFNDISKLNTSILKPRLAIKPTKLIIILVLPIPVAPASMIFVPAVAGLMLAKEVVTDLIKG